MTQAMSRADKVTCKDRSAISKSSLSNVTTSQKACASPLHRSTIRRPLRPIVRGPLQVVSRDASPFAPHGSLPAILTNRAPRATLGLDILSTPDSDPRLQAARRP